MRGGKRLAMQQSMTPIRSQRGFTLLEVTMALAVLGIGIMSIVALQTRDAMYNNSSRRQTQAHTWALDRVERLRALSYTDADLGFTSGTPRKDSQGPYTVQWEVTDNAAKVPDTKKVDVKVLWNNNSISTVSFTKTKSAI